MKNILQQKPGDALNARLRASVNFVDDKDVAGQTVLDIGCGFGWCEVNFLERGVGQITGVEITDADLAAAREGISDLRAKFAVAGALDLPFHDESFDTVVSWEVIEHIPKNTEGQMFAEVYRVLKPAGTFYLSTPNNHPFATLLDPAWWLVGHRHYSPARLVHYATKHNFEVADAHTKGGVWTVLGLLNMYVAKWAFRRGPLFANFFKMREEREYSTNGFANTFMKVRKRA